MSGPQLYYIKEHRILLCYVCFYIFILLLYDLIKRKNIVISIINKQYR